MVAGADSIDDMRLLRHGGMTRLFDRVYAPSTLGSFLRAFEFGHVRQLDAVASRFLTSLTRETPGLLPAARDEFTFVDVDDTIIEVEGYLKQGASFGYSGVRGPQRCPCCCFDQGTPHPWCSHNDFGRGNEFRTWRETSRW